MIIMIVRDQDIIRILWRFPHLERVDIDVPDPGADPYAVLRKDFYVLCHILLLPQPECVIGALRSVIPSRSCCTNDQTCKSNDEADVTTGLKSIQ